MSELAGTARAGDASETRRVRRASLGIIACFAFLEVYYVGLYPGASDANQRSHFQLLRALGERGSAEIEPEIRDLGAHTDIAVHAGRRYSDKAPGLSVLALPGYRILRLFLPVPSSLNDWLVFYGSRLLSVSLVVTVALLVFTRIGVRDPAWRRELPFWLFALLFATPFQVYSRSFFSHALVAALLFLSFAWLATGRGAGSAAAAGLAAGAAVASEYPAITIAICLLAFVALRRDVRRVLAFGIAASLPAAALAAYHARYFGSVLAFPSASGESWTALAGRGVSGVAWPSPTAILGLFADPAHGLLYFSPFLILWPVTAVAALRKLPQDRSLAVTAVGPLLLVLLISGFLPPHWKGGWCLGPRYLIAGFLLVFALLASRAPERRGQAGGALLLAAVTYATVVIAVCGATYWLIPYDSWNPARTVSLHLLRLGLVEFNLGVAAGLPPLVSLAPPLLAAAAAYALMLRALRVPRRAAWIGAASGLAVALLVLALPPSAHAVESSHRDGLAAALLPAMRPGWR